MKKIFIIHGWTYSLNAWDACAAELTKAGFEPVFLHVPGLTEKTDKAWTLPEYVKWLDSVLTKQIESAAQTAAASSAVEPITIVAHSNGGRIALALAAQKPERIANLILIDAAGIRHNELPVRLKRIVFGTAAKIGRLVTANEKIRAVFYKLIGAKDYGRASVHMRETMRNLLAADLTPWLPKITAKTLILWGKNDAATPVSDAHTMHHLISGSQIVIFDHIGHSPHRDAPKRVADEIARFLLAF